MRLTLSLAVTLLLVGAGCSSTTTTTTTTDVATQTPIIGATVENNTVVTSSPVVVSTTMVAPIVKPEIKPIVEAKVEPKACTMDAKVCPNGSSVGRTGPNCEFAACPVVKVEEKPIEKPAETGPKTYTMAEVQAQAAAGKCWTVINAKVYDLSSWISKHPGGSAAIQSLCGINGTAKFTAMHGGATKQEAILATFLVGSLK